MNKGKKKTGLKTFGTAIVYLLALALVVALFATVFYCVQSLEHYNRVYQNPLEVTAKVVRHSEYDDDGDTDYRSHVSYSVDGISYTIQYESRDQKTQLTPVGKMVILQVSPEDPGRTMEDLRDSAWGLAAAAIISTFVASALWAGRVKAGRSKGLSGMPDMETVERDLRRTILGRRSLVFWPLLCVAGLIIRWRYPAVFGQWLTWTAAGSGALFVWCLVRAIRDYHTVRNQRYRVRRDRLVRKEEDYDSENGTTYKLHFRGEDGNQWKTTTTERNYRSMSEGITVLAVYLPGKQKPILHYNTLGEAE